ncbi:hypothetical protein ANO11243_052870 [Dothideomycetidae sp. 11243]|nr:hypothetical protein ANO11243_052870 [fungal sp. No.11243]
MGLLDLPAEIRNHIYTLLFSPAANRTIGKGEQPTTYNFQQTLSLLRTNKQIRSEASAIFHAQNQFIVIDTPWAARAEHYVHFESKVPIVVSSDRVAAGGFEAWTMQARIHAPDFGVPETGARSFVVHLDDLAAFCRTWLCSDLSNPGLNSLLELEFVLRDPCAREWDEPRIAKETQRKLLLPFAAVKGLKRVSYSGPLSPLRSVVDELKKRMAEPYESPESCLRRATAFKDEGNNALRLGKYEDALESYRLAWEAMHIVVNGRWRFEHAMEWYNKILLEEPYKGMQGQVVRLGLRVRLVANTVQLYLLMERYEDAKFWGMRTINLLRQAIGLPLDTPAEQPEDEVVANFLADDVGKIYFRTAMACKALDDMYQARALLKVAAVYLPRDRRVKEEVAALAPRIL